MNTVQEHAESLTSKGKGPDLSIGGLEDYAREVTRSLSEDIEAESRSFAVKRLNLISENLEVLAGSLAEAAGKFREKESEALAEMLEAGARGLGRLSDNFKDERMQNMINDVEDFARKRPVVSVCALMGAGVLIWWFSSSSRRAARRPTDGGRAPFVEDITQRKVEESYEPH